MNRLIAIGDIHGHLDKLEALLGQIVPTADDQLVFLGDYIDRGPQSKGVIDRLVSLQRELPKTIFLRGNHEQLFLDFLHATNFPELPAGYQPLSALSSAPECRGRSPSEDVGCFMQNGGRATLDSGYATYSREERALVWQFPGEHLGFLLATGLWWEWGDYLFVHANINPYDGNPVSTHDIWYLLWSRDFPSRQEIPGETLLDRYTVVCGHTPVRTGQPQLFNKHYFLDTGASLGGPLTAADLLTRKIWQAG